MSGFSLMKVSFVGKFPFIFILVALLWSPWMNPFAYGAKTAKPEIADLSLEQLMAIEVSTVTGASKFAQKVTEAPSSVTIVTHTDIARNGYRTLADVLRSVRGFYVSNDRAYSYIGSRGFSRPGDYNTRILLLVDGHRTNDGIYNSAYIGEDFILDIDLIDRIEIIRGPGASLYGNSAFFGVINVITKMADAYNGFDISGTAGSFDTYSERVTYGKKLSNGFEFLLSGTHWASKGQELYFKEFDAPETNNGWSTGCDNEKSGSLFVNLSYRDLALQAAYVSRHKDIPTGSYGTIINDDRSNQTDTRSYLDVKYSKELGPATRLFARVFYDYYRYDGNWSFDYPPINQNEDLAESRSFGSAVDITTTLFGKHKVNGGISYENYYLQKQTNHDLDPVAWYLRDTRSSDIWAVYLQDQVSIRDNFIINAGIRYDRYKTFGNSINPRLALIYTPFSKTTVKLLYGQAFRAPNTYELYYSDGGLSQLPNPDLKAERIQTYELILEQYVQNYRFSLSGFYYRIKDLITFEIDSSGASIFRNVNEIEAKGGEFEIEAKWSNGIEAKGSYTYTSAYNKETGIGLTNSPKHLAKLNAYIPLAKKISAGIELQYTSSRKLVDKGSTGGYVVTNFTLLGKELVKNLDASLSVYNVFDKAYGDPVSSDFTQRTMPQDGRNWRLKVNYRF